ncbi:hypothetical protein MUGA111182_12585 [Mucilaginibacter galii]|uniref:Ppx/GppA phosphatase domain-containing protein n=1 Tax=Mucilaginibacter galii TaxID=2005073 RepID=A0A917N2J0_9SPHI|nr:hypothetical protein [Mucilaginibacter galii]GGI51948.1 hypothetical protein GCM10011425_31600 [Mucilaginibacter galii]
MQIKPAGRIAILLIIGIAAFFLIKHYVPKDKLENPASRNSTSQSGSYDAPQKDSAQTDDKAAGRTFEYTPEKPQNGILRGVVEVGATGFNSFVINMDKEKRWEIVSKDFGESLAYEDLANTDDIRTGLKKYLASMFEKGVNKKNMHFVISSGAQKAPKTAQVAAELKKMGFVVNLVTAAQEGKFAFKATVPPGFQDDSFLIDIGSGNTKVSWMEDGNLKALELPGAKYFEKGTADDAVYEQVKQALGTLPKNKRNVGFIIGGVPFSLAKQTRKGEERYTVLNNPDTYKIKDKKMGSGINIYKAAKDATNTDTFVFDWDANFTIGFLLSLRYID